MLKKLYRLNTKDVLFLTRKKQFFASGIFGFFYIPQYPNRKYNQISFHVSIKLSKRSSTRNIIKRAVVQWIQRQISFQEMLGKGYWKIFIILQKNKLGELQKLIESKDKKVIIEFVEGQIQKSFTSLCGGIGKPLKVSSKV